MTTATRTMTRIGIAAFVAIGAGMATPHSASAIVSGGCTATGNETSTDIDPKHAAGAGGTSFDITTGSEWHVHRGSFVSGTGTAPSDQTEGHVDVVVFGLAIPLKSGTGHGTTGSAGTFKVDDLSKYTRTVDITGGSDSCSGSLSLIVDDVSATSTLAGQAGLGATALGVIGVGGVAMRRRGI